MPSPDLSPPLFGEPCPIRPSLETLQLLAHRRSSSAQTLTTPGPTSAERDEILQLAARVPDHGKLNPWRFMIIEGEDKAALVGRLRSLAARQPAPGKAEAVLAKLSTPPLTIAVISTPKAGAKPVWEQELSAGAVCTLMLLAAAAMGFGAVWITDWYSYDAEALEILGVAAGEKVVGFIHFGTPSEAPLERVRPNVASLTTRWTAPASI